MYTLPKMSARIDLKIAAGAGRGDCSVVLHCSSTPKKRVWEATSHMSHTPTYLLYVYQNKTVKVPCYIFKMGVTLVPWLTVLDALR